MSCIEKAALSVLLSQFYKLYKLLDNNIYQSCDAFF